MKIALISLNSEDKETFFDMLRTNLEHGPELGNQNDYQTSIGVNICVKNIYDEDNQIAKLILWDISSKPFFRMVRPLFYSGAIGSIVLHSDNSVKGINRTLAILEELAPHNFPKFLLILTKPDINNSKQDDLILNFTLKAKKLGFEPRYFELSSSYNHKPDSYDNFSGFWKKLRFFYETSVLEIFSNAVDTIPGNSYDINKFRRQYFENLANYDTTLKIMYSILDNTGFEHDSREIYVRLREGLFSINIFSSACYYHYPNTDKSKYFCMVPAEKTFMGWSNLKYLPRNFLLSLAKTLYLLDGNYDSVVRKQLKDLSR